MAFQEYCLKWEEHQSTFQFMFIQLLERESLCDVTLVCEGKSLRAHRLVLSAFSELFESLLSNHEDKEPIVILTDVKFDIMKALVQFMYQGEIKVQHSQLNTLLQIAEELKIIGLGQEAWRSIKGKHQISNEPLIHDTVTPPKSPVSTQPSANSRKRKTKSVCDDIYQLPKIANTYQNQHCQAINEDDTSDDEFVDRFDTEASILGTEPSVHVKTEFSDDDSDCEVIQNSVENSTLLPESRSAISEPTTVSGQAIVVLSEHIKHGGDRNNFWDIPSTKMVLESIRNKEIEMKRAAQILGVPYRTLYGRYRFAYGSLKVSPDNAMTNDARPRSASTSAVARKKKIGFSSSMRTQSAFTKREKRLKSAENKRFYYQV